MHNIKIIDCNQLFDKFINNTDFKKFLWQIAFDQYEWRASFLAKHKYPTKFSKQQLYQQLYQKIILSKQYEILYFISRTKIMELLFAKPRKGNLILLTFSKNCKVKVNWNRKWGYELLILFFKFFIFSY